MKANNIDLFIGELISILRDMKLNSVLGGNNYLSIKKPKRGIFSPFYKGYRKLSELNKLGGIITGSQALKYYSVGGVPLLYRKPDDWDILLEEKSFYKFCLDNKITKIDYGVENVSINFTSGVYLGQRNYGGGDIYAFEHDFDIIAKKNLPDYVECDGYRISTLDNIVHEKLELIKKDLINHPTLSDFSSKHINDCLEIMIKLKAKTNFLDTCKFTVTFSDKIENTLKLLNDVVKIAENEKTIS